MAEHKRRLRETERRRARAGTRQEEPGVRDRGGAYHAQGGLGFGPLRALRHDPVRGGLVGGL